MKKLTAEQMKESTRLKEEIKKIWKI